MGLDSDLAAYQERCCTGKPRLGWRVATNTAARLRVQHPGEDITPYHCAFCGAYHVGHSLGVAKLEHVATMLRARAGNAPVPPGSGTTRRQRRKANR